MSKTRWQNFVSVEVGDAPMIADIAQLGIQGGLWRSNGIGCKMARNVALLTPLG